MYNALYFITCSFQYKNLNNHLCLVYYRDQRNLSSCIPMVGALKVCGGFWGEYLCKPVISALLPPGFHWICKCIGVFLQLRCILLEQLSIGLLLGDCFCKIITCHYCFFCMQYFNVVHVFYVMRNSSSCDIFHCIIILKAICLIL